MSLAAFSRPTTISHDRNRAALRRARKCVAGGDSSTMRVLPYHPTIVAERGDGAWVFDLDGNRYLDMNMAYGPLFFGHRPQFLIERVSTQLHERGSQLGFPTELNARVAEKIQRLMPSMELMRFANSGTEAIASATRVARHHTGKEMIVLFEGHYHGWSDTVFHRYHAPLDAISDTPGYAALPGTSGMNGGPHNAVMCRWNDPSALEEVIERNAGNVAAVLMEPIMGNGGTIAPINGYLNSARELCDAHGCTLIFDEVMTGMRVAKGGAQERFGVTPDLTVISKVLGGGVPIAAFGGRAEIMDCVVRGDVFHGGVYSSNAMVLSAAEAVLDQILERHNDIYPQLEEDVRYLADGISTIFESRQIAHKVQYVGAMLSMFFTLDHVESLDDYRAVRRHGDFERYIRFEHALADAGVYIHPNMFEPLFPSICHCREEMDFALNRIEDCANT